MLCVFCILCVEVDDHIQSRLKDKTAARYPGNTLTSMNGLTLNVYNVGTQVYNMVSKQEVHFQA